MEINFDITQPVFTQTIEQFRLIQKEGNWVMNPKLGTDSVIKWHLFPGDLEFYYYGRTTYKEPIEMRSVNPEGSEWFLIHVNLSQVGQKKRVGDQSIDFQKYLPAAILLYGPGLEIETSFPEGTEAEVCGMRFSRHLLDEYFGDKLNDVALDKPLTYEDLDPELELWLMETLQTFDEKLTTHRRVLGFLQKFFNKLSKHDPAGRRQQLHSEDYRNLMKAAGILRDPKSNNVPSLEQLAELAGMSTTKFKTTFKEVFGTAPMKYRNKIRLEYAREQLRRHRMTPSELSYELGYTHPSNFTTAYKKYFNTLPSEENT